jgi:exosortase
MEPIRFHLTRSTIALSIKVIAVLGATIAIYFQDLTIIANEAIRSELMSYILAIPFLLAYILYRKRKMLRATIPFETTNPIRKPTYTREIVGALLCLTAFLLYWHGSYTFYPLEYHVVSLPLFVAGLILIIFNTKTIKVLAFPIAFLLFLTPPPSEIAYIAGASVATLSSEVSYNILKTIGLPVSLTTEYGAPALVVTDPSGSSIPFVIGIASSGIYSLIGFSIFATFLAYIARGPTWKRATLFFASLPLIYALNIMRIIILVSMGYWQGVNVAWDVFHLFGGWVLIFLGSLILLSLSEKIWKIQIFATKPRATSCPTCSPSLHANKNFCPACGKLLKHIPVNISKRDLSKIAALIISVSLIITISVPVFALSEGPAEVLIQTLGGEQATTTQVLPEISGYALRFVYRDKKFEEIAQRDAALVYAYTPMDESGKTIWIALEIGSSRSAWHSWEASVITWPQRYGRPYAIQLDLREAQLLQNPPIIGKFFAFQHIKSNLTQVVLYWYENAIFNTGSGSEQKYVKISLIAYPKNPEGVPATEDMLLPFGKAIVNYWQPIKTWSQIALLISQNGTSLIAITAVLLATLLSYQVIKDREERKSNLKLYDKLALQEEKLILQAIHQASQKEKPTANTIASHYEKLTGKTIELESLIEKLNEAEKAGLIKRDITSQRDEPILTWKSQVPSKGRLV